MAVKIQSGAGVTRGPGFTDYQPAKIPTIARASDLAAGGNHTVKVAGTYQVVGTSANDTSVVLPPPSVVGGPVTLIGPVKVNGAGATVNGSHAVYDGTLLAGATLTPGKADDWVVIPHGGTAANITNTISITRDVVLPSLGFPDVYPVGSFGAVGNGFTDDTAAIQAAINGACLNGGTVYFPQPHPYYLISSQLNVPSPHVVLMGQGGSRLAPMITQQTYGAPIFYVSASHVIIRGLSGQYAATTALTSAASAGASAVVVASSAGIVAGDYLILDSYPNQEAAVVASVAGTTVNLVGTLALNHAIGCDVRDQAVVQGTVDGKPGRDVAAFAAFRDGDDCSVVDCGVNAMVTAVKFRGSTVSLGTNVYRNRVSGLDCAFCSFGVLAEQQTGFLIERERCTNIVFSQDGHVGPAGSAPPHAIYMTGVAGSSNSTDVTIRGVYVDSGNTGSGGSAVKVKFTHGGSVSGIVIENAERGFDFEQFHGGVLCDFTVNSMLACTTSDSQQAGLNVLNCNGSVFCNGAIRVLTAAGAGIDCPAVYNRLDDVAYGQDDTFANLSVFTAYSAAFSSQCFRITGTPRTVIDGAHVVDTGGQNKYVFGFQENGTLVAYASGSVLKRPFVYGTTHIATVDAGTTGVVWDIDNNLLPASPVFTDPGSGAVLTNQYVQNVDGVLSMLPQNTSADVIAATLPGSYSGKWLNLRNSAGNAEVSVANSSGLKALFESSTSTAAYLGLGLNVTGGYAGSGASIGGIAFVVNGVSIGNAGAGIWAVANEAQSSGHLGTDIVFGTITPGGTTQYKNMRLYGSGDVLLNATGSALSTGATSGFTFLPNCAGKPTGSVTGHTGANAFVFDTTDQTLYVNTSSANWFDVRALKISAGPATGNIAAGTCVEWGSSQNGNTYTLPDPATCKGATVEFKCTNNGGTYSVSIASASGNVEGVASYTLTSTFAYSGVTVRSFGSDWWIVGKV